MFLEEGEEWDRWQEILERLRKNKGDQEVQANFSLAGTGGKETRSGWWMAR